MPIYEVSVRATYYEDVQIEADDKDEAYKIAMQTFEPNSDNCMSIDVFGLSPWEEDGDPNAADKYHDAMRGV